MKSILFSAISLMLLILFMEGFNRLNKSLSKEKKPFSIMGVAAYNSGDAIPDKCTWHCSLHTNYCKANHVGILKNYFHITDKLYFGIVAGLANFNFGFSPEFNYGIANLLILVLFIPITIIYSFYKGFKIQREINQINRKWKQ